MARMKYEITQLIPFKDSGGNDVDVYDVNRSQVWHNTHHDLLNCTECSGPLAAMKSDCVHCRAVRRFINRRKASSGASQ